MTSEDYYAVLGVGPQADAAELRRAWRRLALQWHPDRAGAEATGRFQRLQAAYAVLSDVQSRAAYDRRRSRQARVARGPAAAVMLHRVSGPLQGLLVCGIARYAEGDVIELILTPEELAEGGMITIAMRVQVDRDGKLVDDLFSAWLAVPAGAFDGELLVPSAWLPGMIRRVMFRIREARH